MPSIAIIDLATSQIQHFYDDEVPNQAKFGGPWGWSTHTLHMLLPDGIEKDVAASIKQEDGTYIIQIDEEKQAAKVAGLWTALRAERRTRLAACDWTQLPDTPLTEEQKATWSVYRQALRDLPANTTDIYNIEWPVLP
jgi:hypothetical protein